MEQKEIWDIIADSWTNLRVKPYQEVIGFSKSKLEEPILDIGCGNCRNLVPFLKKNKKCIGLDFSEEMIKMARKFLKKKGYKTKLKVSDMVDLPFKNNSIGTIICNASLHSLTKKEDRLKALFEMKRVLKKDSKILLSTWYRYQSKFTFKIIPSIFKKEKFNITVTWNYHGRKYKRIYHLYSKKELRKELSIVGLNVEKIWVSKGNIWCLVRR